ncbi:enoyl-CoA hydratase/isomerase family protein [Chelativorans sp. ZYF759]|uniref:enoyl-CoA hydratase/isomerase family protein n=1 Tax=Chelativorans sp. ZYF759 TaxID=2692213 RepID=UPI00145D768D|nr:enoyl-CoA hydratase/isomerase family protein [Chelativorans sp. ZYF759]NMG41880.1 enoyl-CoA hydratase/isomerase family protein [Chelativorans sp. ZYF759]
MTDEPEILFEKRGHAGLITLNRPKALNALTLDMVRKMHPQLAEWAQDRSVAHVVVRAAGEKAFCAGGDIRQLHDWGRSGDPRFLDFYREEYRLNSFIKRYPKPYVALVDGIVMGGGVGLSIHGSHRVAGDRIVFAMPETGIGLFPDVGGSFFLPRLPGYVGTWLALTGARLKQADVAWGGLATQCMPSTWFDELTEALCVETETSDVLERFRAAPIEEAALPALMPVIDRCFSAEAVPEIVERLEAQGGGDSDWATKQASAIRSKSPTSLAVALRQMRKGAELDFEDCMRMEWRIVNRVIQGHEFFEGVRSVIIDKDNEPRWQPATLDELPEPEIDAYFAPLEEELDLEGLDDSAQGKVFIA